MSNNILYVTPTHERAELLERCLAFYADFDICAIVVDSSIQAYAGNIPASVRYIHTPGKSFNDKLQVLPPLLNEKYVVFMADDDFILPSSVALGASFLESNPAYASVQGRHVSFDEFRPDGALRFMETDLHSWGLDVAENSPLERVEALFNCYMNTFYSLQRAEVWRFFIVQVLGNWVMDNSKEHEFALLEIIQIVNSLFFGKHKILDDIWILREDLPFSKTSQIDIDLFNHELPTMMEPMCHLFEDKFGVNANQFQSSIGRAIKAYHSGFQSRKLTDAGSTCRRVARQHLLEQGNADLEPVISSIDRYRDSVVSAAENKFGKGFWYSSMYGNNWLSSVSSRIHSILNKEQKIVVYGAGEHTAALFDVSDIAQHVVAITDGDKQKWGTKILGFDCIPPGKIFEYANSVVISSLKSERDIYRQLVSDYGHKLTIYTLFSEQECISLKQ